MPAFSECLFHLHLARPHQIAYRGCCLRRHHQDGSPQASQPASEEAQSLSPRRPSSASADAQSEISCFTDGSGRLSRVHSNPLFAEEAASGVRQKRGSTGTSLPGDAPSSKEGGAEAESNPAADERIMGALGKVLDTSLKLVRELPALCISWFAP